MRKSEVAKLTTDWLNDNDPARKVRRGASSAPINDKNMRGRWPREIRTGRKKRATVKCFVEKSRDYGREECLFVPGAAPGSPANVTFCGKTIAAARYMLLLTRGAPKSDCMVTRHLCGNGHLSCVNPSHLVWGTQADNIGDMVRHRGKETAKERLEAIPE